MSLSDPLISRAKEYATRQGLTLGQELGHGVHGIVFATKSQPEKSDVFGVDSAIKAHEREPDYCRERDIYLRLHENEVTAIRGCHVPQLLGYDDASLIIEMSVVRRPFVLDFAGAFLDEAPDFSEEVLADWQAEKVEQFEGRWPEIQAILVELQAYGIYMIDVSPSNICLDK